MTRPPPTSSLTFPLFPYPSRFRSLLGYPQRRPLQASQRLGHRRHELGELRPGHACLDIGAHRLEEAAQQSAHVLAELAADEIQGLDAVGALVDLRDARVDRKSTRLNSSH